MKRLLKLFFFFSFFLGFCSASEKMSLEEKVGQLLIVHFHGEEANQEAKILVQDLHVGGIIYYKWANALSSPEQVKKLSKGLQELAKQVPLFISIDQEGGKVVRLTEGFTVFPSNQVIGQTGEPRLAMESALATGKELLAVGINLNFAPVVDINSNPKNPVIGTRSFGDTPEKVTLFGLYALEGFHQAGIITSLKHFPGHGDVDIDSHHDLPILKKSKDQLESFELYPFRNLAFLTDTIMTAHILAPALDPKNCATLSPEILSILRKEIGFQGLIVSDSLVMEGVLKSTSTVDEAAVQAFLAGCDLLVLGGRQLNGSETDLELSTEDVRRISHSILEAVKTGRIPQERIDESVERILRLKERYLFQSREANFDPEAHKLLLKKIEALSQKRLSSLSVPIEEANRIGEKIWKNECGGKIEGLTHWNAGENFGSFGIGHFIWFPSGRKEIFQESFPELILFMKEQNVSIPSWITGACPWSSRQEFEVKKESEEMKTLRQFLLETKGYQALFMAKRLEKSLPSLLEKANSQDREKILVTFNRLASDPRGLYALIDYLNFKGEGTSPKETYQGKGWGLLQVLQSTSPNSSDIVKDFSEAAKTVLKERVEISSSRTQEEKWLKGWLKRLDTYPIFEAVKK